MLAAGEIRLLDRLVLGASTASADPSGVRRARQTGAGREFHDYRHYEPGDDPRSIDWMVEARHRQLVVRVSRADAHTKLHVLVDASASMGIGDKLRCARKLAASLCYVAAGRDAVGLSLFRDTLVQHVRPASGRPHVMRLFDVLGTTDAAGPSAIDRSLMAYGAVARGPGLVVVVSDFFDPACTLAGMRYLQYRGFSLALVQVVAPEEMAPVIRGRMQLFDVENAASEPVVVDAAAVAGYRARFDEHTESLRTFCATNGVAWVQVESSVLFDGMIAALGRVGLLEAGG